MLAVSVAMPKAAVNEDSAPVLPNDDVRTAWEGTDVQPEPEADGVKSLAQDKFGLGIRRADTCHHL
jgi:hypothetical protein